MHDLVLKKIIKKRFSCHRSIISDGFEENSLEAIRAAFKYNLPFIEFDIMLADDGKMRTGHPPQKPADDLKDILSFFEEKQIYPKIDIKSKLPKQNKEAINKTLHIIGQQRIPFVLITLDNANLSSKDFMYYELFLANCIKNKPKIKLSIDLAKYKKETKNTDKQIKKHIKNLGSAIHTLAAEIHENDPDKIVKFAKENNIKTINFWLRGWPDVTEPMVSEETILSAFDLEQKYGVKIYFDMHSEYVVPTSST